MSVLQRLMQQVSEQQVSEQQVSEQQVSEQQDVQQVEQVEEQVSEQAVEQDEQQVDEEVAGQDEQVTEQDEQQDVQDVEGTSDDLFEILSDYKKEVAAKEEQHRKEVEQAIKRAEVAEDKLKRTILSNFLMNRKDEFTDVRIVASLFNFDAIDVNSDKPSEQIAKELQELVRRYPSLVNNKSARYAVKESEEGIVTMNKIEPIGRPMASKPLPAKSNSDLLREAESRARREGTPEARIEYANLKRRLGL